MKWMMGLLMVSLCVTGCERTEKEEAAAPAPVAEVKVISPQLAESTLKGDLAAVKQALAEGVAVDALDEGQHTMLMLAAFEGRFELCKFLLEQGADVHHADAINRTALMFASTGPNLDTIKLLLEKGAEVNAIDSHEDWTALMMAAAEGQTEVVKFLLANGADVTMKDVDGEDSAYFARQRGFEALAQMLEQAAAAK